MRNRFRSLMDQEGHETVADFTFVYEKVEGEIRILTHHSSLEYSAKNA